MNYIDLCLPSGTLWAEENIEGYYTFDDAVENYSDALPTKEQFEELQDHCKWEWNGSGYVVTGPKGKYIVLPAEGFRYCDVDVYNEASYGYYWSSMPNGSDDALGLYFDSGNVYMNCNYRCYGKPVRLVK